MKKILLLFLFLSMNLNAEEITFINQNKNNLLEVTYYFCGHPYGTVKEECGEEFTLTIHSKIDNHSMRIPIPDNYKSYDSYILRIKNVIEKDSSNHIIYSKNVQEIFKNNCFGFLVSQSTADRNLHTANVGVLLKDVPEIPTINCVAVHY